MYSIILLENVRYRIITQELQSLATMLSCIHISYSRCRMVLLEVMARELKAIGTVATYCMYISLLHIKNSFVRTLIHNTEVASYSPYATNHIYSSRRGMMFVTLDKT